ncbi:MAG TPA: sigma-70 family RNA polymerase sigma factor [Tepidisphaeraceae bacterium]|nr:sigma-70 family RNA polymerase sigma factor [Tepidisphaeraceae bacterium]
MPDPNPSNDDFPAHSPAHPAGNAHFATTRWTLVVAAGAARPDGTPEARKALSELCALYWYPVYAYVRRRGKNAEDSLDLTQGFFTRLIEKNDLAAADPARGRFRGWLLASVKNYLANEWDRVTARKRGGGRSILSIDADDAEDRYRREPAHHLTPERIFDRRWALTLLERALSALQSECERDGKAGLFAALKPTLTGDGRDPSNPYRDLAEVLGMTEGSVKVAAHRLRRRYRDLLRLHIAETVGRPEDVDDEIRDLFAAVRMPD